MQPSRHSAECLPEYQTVLPRKAASTRLRRPLAAQEVLRRLMHRIHRLLAHREGALFLRQILVYLDSTSLILGIAVRASDRR